MTRDEAERACAEDRAVVYRAYPNATPEVGKVTRCNDRYAFVIYVGDRYPKATAFADLQLEHGSQA